MKRVERCSCTAKLEITLPSDINGYANWEENMNKRFADWRVNHLHEMPEPELEVPTVVESGSSHERDQIAWGVEDRAPIGFRANP